jgi:hypothetical protein
MRKADRQDVEREREAVAGAGNVAKKKCDPILYHVELTPADFHDGNSRQTPKCVLDQSYLTMHFPIKDTQCLEKQALFTTGFNNNPTWVCKKEEFSQT